MGDDVVVIDCVYRRCNNGVFKPRVISDYIRYVIGKINIDLLYFTLPTIIILVWKN